MKIEEKTVYKYFGFDKKKKIAPARVERAADAV